MITIIIPIKPLAVAKSRLAPVLSDDERAGLVMAMAKDVLEAVLSAESAKSPLIVSADNTILQLAEAAGCQILQDDDANGYNEAAALGVAQAEKDGAEGILILPADLPLITAADVKLLLRSISAPCVVIAPDQDEEGSNALAIAPPTAMKTAFGTGSFQRHCEDAARLGLSLEVVNSPGLALDIDTPDDLERLSRMPGNTHTQKYLKSLGVKSADLVQ